MQKTADTSRPSSRPSNMCLRGKLSAETRVVALSPPEFAAAAAGSDQFEIASSEVALERAQSKSVKEFAQIMIADHTASTKGLMAAAAKDGVPMGTDINAVQAAQVSDLKAIEDAEFDRAYIDAQIAAHQEALALLTAFGEAGSSPALQAHAQKTAPVVQMHLEMVDKLSQSQ